MTIWTVVGILLVLLLIVGVGLYSGRKVSDSDDFLTGKGKEGAFLVSGTIMGGLVGSQATIGTAQLAFSFGIAAWWFTLGAGIGCCILALVYVKPLRRTGCTTELSVISAEYGDGAGSLGSILCSVGIFISVLAQVISCVGLLTVLFPSLPMWVGAFLSIAVMGCYVIFGGAWGAGMGGIMKLALLSISSVLCLAFVLFCGGGLTGIAVSLKTLLCGTDLGMVQKAANGVSNILTMEDLSQRYYNLIARGAMKDIGSGISLLLGVLSTQTYAQAIWSGKSDKKAKRGALLSAAVVPPLGIVGIIVGLYMRGHYITSGEVSALTALGKSVPNLPVIENVIQVFPAFVIHHMPALFGGIVLGTLLITSVGGGAGLALGMSTIIVKDIYKRFTSLGQGKQELLAMRLTLVAILVLAAGIAIFMPAATINDLGFLSMGLRGTVVFIPLNCALFLKGYVNQTFVLLSVVLSPLVILLGVFLKVSFDPLFLGIGISLLLCGVGLFVPRGKEGRGSCS